MLIISYLITIIAIIVAVICAVTKHKIDKATEIANDELHAKNRQLNEYNDILKDTSANLCNDIVALSTKKSAIEENINDQEKHLDALQSSIEKTLKNQQNLSTQAFKNWWTILENDYKEKEDEYNSLVKSLEDAYTDKQLKLLEETDKYVNDLNKIKSTRDAAIEAQRKEQEIKERLSFYCLTIPANELDDIKKLEHLKPDLHNPRILSMLIWSTYFQKPMTTLCNNVLGTTQVTGIYKITNQLNNMCYIGQAVNCRPVKNFSY